MSDSQIRRELTENLERYESNAVLNKLTPNRQLLTRGTSGDLSIPSSALRKLTQSSSRRTTPGRLGRRAGHNDSNIVTSPVKTLRRYRSHSVEDDEEHEKEQQLADYKDEGGTDLGFGGDYGEQQQQEEQHHIKIKDNVTVNVPLNDSPKEPMRKGTPKVLSARASKRESPPIKPNINPPLEPQKSKTSFTLFRDIAKLPPPPSHLNASTGSGYADDDNDNDNDHENDYARSNDTLLSDIPSDLLSPEKHIYPKENLTSSAFKTTRQHDDSKRSPGAVPVVSLPKSSFTKTSLYPDLSQTVDKTAEDVPSLNTIPTLSNAFPIQTSTKVLKPASPIKPTPILNKLSPMKQSQPSQVLKSSSIRSSASPQRDEETQAPPLFSPIASTTRRSMKQKSTPDSPIRSPPRRLPVTSTNLSQSNNTLPDHNHGKLDLAQFESSDEEPVPELTVPIDMLNHDDINDESTELVNMKRKDETLDEDPHVSKRPKKQFSIYPDLLDGLHEGKNAGVGVDNSVEKEKVESDIHILNQSIIDDRPITSLYPSLLSPLSRQHTSEKEKEEKEKEVSAKGTSGTQLGDSDNWTKVQWIRFIGCYERFEMNGHDYSEFDSDVLEYLKCDENEILLKIGFYKELLEESGK